MITSPKTIFSSLALSFEKREHVGGLVIHENAIELSISRPDGSISFSASVVLPPKTILSGKIIRREDLRQALSALRKKASSLSIESVIVSVPASLSSWNIFEFPLAIAKEQLGEAIRLACDSAFPFPSSSLFIGAAAAEIPDTRKTTVLSTFMKKEDSAEYESIVTESGFPVVALETHSMSVARVSEMGKTELVVFFEPSEVTLSVMDNNLPVFQIAIPRKQLVRSGVGEKPASEPQVLAEWIKRFAHSAVSGRPSFRIERCIAIGNAEEVAKVTPFLRGSPVPEFFFRAGDKNKKSSFSDGWELVSAGVADRCLIARKNDKIISFLPLGTHEAYFRSQLLSLIDFFQKASVSFGFFMVLVFGASFGLLGLVEKNSASMPSGPGIPPEFQIYSAFADSFNASVATIASMEKHDPAWENFFLELDKIRQPGIVFRRIDIPSGNGVIIIEGTATNQDALQLVKARLEGSDVFTFDPLPLKIFLEKENISFTFRLKLKEPQKFFP